MALSGSFTQGFSNNGAFRLRVEWSATQNINENYSVVTAHLYIDSLQSWASVYDATSSITSLSINGNTKYFSNNSTINAWQSKWMGSHTVTVYHTNDGSKWFDIYATHNFDITWNGSYIGVVDVYGSAWLNTIPRASVPTVATNGIQYGDSIHVNLNRASEDFTHYVSIDIGNVKTDIGAMDRHTNSFDFVLPLDWCARIPTRNANSGKFTVHTYNGNGGYIGTNEVWFTANVPASVVPTVSAEQVTHVEAVEGLASKFNAYVQSKSKIRATAAGTGAFVGGVQCSSIVGHKIEMNGQIFNSNDATSEVLNVAGSQTIKYTVTDSRGRTASRTVTISALPYSPPVLSLLKASRCDADGTPNDEGEYAKVTIGAAVSAVNNLNDKIFTISKKTVTSEIWTNQNVTSAAYIIETDVIISDISGNNAWDIKFTVNDYFSTDDKVSKTMQLSTAFSLIDYFAGGKGIAFGKVAEKDGMQIALAAEFIEAPTIIAPVSDAADGAFARLRRKDETLLAFIGTGADGTGLNIHLYDGVGLSGTVSIGENGDIYTTGKLKVDGSIESSGMVSKELVDNSDLNAVQTPGLYYCPTNARAGTISNVAGAAAFSLFVERHAGIKQTFTRYETGNPATYIRNYYDGTWGAWRQVAFI
ncbi:putative viral structural protein (duf859) [Trichococcus flocculiformis]|uniref:Viral structural protein (Duf859) n=1 Tax=Trichococcus flocculiformis TaxID=82803 RepID=A0AB38BGZ1_9LACT|nr:DUF859 family phage minor structural protein [Trichococcus flocculiformis]CZQ83357.1 putative viral structural protein (duf859) [Trichococcus flocculiformis]SFH70186.1 virus protein of unknown function [Trichococcus flocculiformis]